MNNRLTAKERAHIQRVKQLPCSVCDAPGPSDAHHIEQRSQLTRSECAELIEYVLAWSAEHGIGTDRVDPETGEIYT